MLLVSRFLEVLSGASDSEAAVGLGSGGGYAGGVQAHGKAISERTRSPGFLPSVWFPWGAPSFVVPFGTGRQFWHPGQPYDWSVPLPGWLARFNRGVSNPVLRPMAARLPYFGVVLHRGRVSGRLYRTPVTTFPRGDGFVIALTYGRDVDWVKNVLASGMCGLVYRRRAVGLVGPSITPLSEHGGAIPGFIRATRPTGQAASRTGQHLPRSERYRSTGGAWSGRSGST